MKTKSGLNLTYFGHFFIFEMVYIAICYLIVIFASLRFIQIAPEIVAAPKVPLWQILLSFAIGTVLILLALKFFKRGIIFHIFFSLSLFFGIELVLSLVLPFIPAIILGGGLIFLRYLYPRVWIQNLVLILGLSGISVSLGLNIHWLTAVLLLVILSCYDIIAVYKTRHMTKMAQGLIAKKIFPALIVPGRFSALGALIGGVKRGNEFIFLGSGDIAFPLLFSVSVLPLGIGKTIACATGGFLGIIASFLIFNLQKKRRPLPALPPIALLSILGFLVGWILL